MKGLIPVIIAIISSLLVGWANADEDAEAVAAAHVVKLDQQSPAQIAKYRLIKIEKAKPPKQMIDQHNPKCVYCLLY